MARFLVVDYRWIGVFIGGQPFLPPDLMEPLTIPVTVPEVTVKAHVNVVYDEQMGQYDTLRLRANYGGPVEAVAVDFPPTDGEIELSLQVGMAIDDPGWYFGVELLAAQGSMETSLGQHLVCWHPVHDGCPVPPAAPVASCSSGGLALSSPDQNGNSRLSYLFGGGSDPHGLGASAVFGTQSTSWGFMALPDDVSVVNAGQTAETPPRNCIHATVPAGDGTSRLYCSDSATGDFVPAGSYGTSFAWNGSGYVETIGDSQVHYDSSGVLQRVVSGQSEHIYSRGTGWVDITANTATPTKHRYNLQGDNVQSIVEYAQLPGSGWAEARRLEVGWSGSQVTSFTSYPGVRTTSFSYIDGSLASYEDCSGRAWNLQYEEE